MSEDKKKPKQRHRLLVNPDELGLTARIKKALIREDMGITQRIKKAVDSAQTEGSFLYGLKKHHFITIGIMLFLIVFLGYIGFRTRTVTLDIKYPNGEVEPTKMSLPFYLGSKEIPIPPYERNVTYKRFDIYGSDLGPEEFEVFNKDGMVNNKYKLMPGSYTIKIKKEGYSKKDIALTVGDVSVTIPLQLEPLAVKTNSLKLFLSDPMLPNQKITPDDVILVENGKSIKTTPVKSGSYVVRILKNGYHPKEFKIQVDESGAIASNITLEYKKRSAKFLIKDGLSETGQEPLLAAKDLKLLQEGKQIPYENNLIQPGYYDLVVERSGYKKHQQRITVPPGETQLSIPIFLTPQPREVVVKPNYSVTPPDVKPDKAFLKDLLGKNKEVIPITPGLTIAPGRYWVSVEKAGYYSYNGEANITPSNEPFEVKAHLVSASKLIFLKIKSDFDVEPIITPDDLMLDVKALKKGYKSIDWGKVQKPIPPEKTEANISIFLETKPRKVLADLTCDIPGGAITAESMSLTRIIQGELQKTTLVTATETFKPSRYMLEILKSGYESIKEEIIIYPDDNDYVVRRELKAQRPELVLEIDSDYDPGVKVRPDEIRVDRVLVEEGAKLVPGKRELLITKAGYESLKLEIQVNPGKEPQIIKKRMKVKPRILRFDIKGGKGFKDIVPDLVEIGGNEVKIGSKIPPKKAYTVKIEKEGFDTENFTIDIEPSDDDYTLKKVIAVKKRRVVLTLLASFPKGKNLYPPDKCMIGNDSLDKDTKVEPGEFEVVIIKTGYKTISRNVTISPAEEPFKIIEEMQPKPRKVTLDIRYEVEPENRKDRPVIKVRSESTDKVLKTGMDIIPNKYQLSITQPGYEPLNANITVMPSETPYLLTQTLKPAMRTVLFEVTADYPPDTKLQIFKVLVSGQVKQQVAEIRPGQHTLSIEKEGYHPLKDNLKILASEKEFKVLRQLKTKERVVTYAIKDAETGDPLKPDTISLGNLPVTGTAVFKPGKYQLQIKTQGYRTVTEEMELPPGDKEYNIERRMTPSYRLVTYEIKGDYDSNHLKPKELTFNGEVVDGNTKFRPGGYDLVLYVPGYERDKDRLIIPPSQEDFLLRRNLVSKKRKVVFNITSTFPKGIKLKPDRVTFDAKEFLDGEEIKPKAGGYQVEIKKAGYTTVAQSVALEPSEEVFTLTLELEARARRLKLQIDGDYKPSVPIKLDDLLVDGKRNKEGGLVVPGEHTFTLKKAGYQDMVFKATVEAGTDAYLIKKTLVSKPRQVTVVVKSNFTREVMDQENEELVLTLGDRKPSEGAYKPGSYELNVAHLGYQEIRKKIEVEPLEQPLNLEETLIANKRPFVPEITFDVKPLPNMALHKIRLRNVMGGEANFFIVAPGDELPPSEYQVKIEKEGYETFHRRLIIEPDDRKYRFKAELVAKYVQILVKIKHDIAPPRKIIKNYPNYKITFIGQKDGVGRNVSHGNRIKPGNYLLDINQPGYNYKTPRKKIFVPPGTAPYNIDDKLWAQPRAMSFEMYNKKGVLTKARQVLIGNQVIKVSDKFSPGKKYNFIAKFDKYKTAQKTIEIIPGEGPYVVDVDLIELKKFELKVGRKYHDMVMDNIKYPVEIFADREQLEPHHINLEDVGPVVYYNFYAPKEMRSMMIVVAFYRDQSLVRRKFEFRDLKKIDAGRLLEHLRELAKGARPEQALKRIRRVLRDRQDKFKLKALPQGEREKVINLIRDLDLAQEKDKQLRKSLIKELQRKT